MENVHSVKIVLFCLFSSECAREEESSKGQLNLCSCHWSERDTGPHGSGLQKEQHSSTWVISRTSGRVCRLQSPHAVLLVFLLHGISVLSGGPYSLWGSVLFGGGSLFSMAVSVLYWGLYSLWESILFGGLCSVVGFLFCCKGLCSLWGVSLWGLCSIMGFLFSSIPYLQELHTLLIPGVTVVYLLLPGIGMWGGAGLGEGCYECPTVDSNKKD